MISILPETSNGNVENPGLTLHVGLQLGGVGVQCHSLTLI